MIWIGWLVVVGVAIYVTAAAWFLIVAARAFTGRADPFGGVFAVAAAVMWWLAWWTAPFEVTMK